MTIVSAAALALLPSTAGAGSLDPDAGESQRVVDEQARLLGLLPLADFEAPIASPILARRWVPWPLVPPAAGTERRDRDEAVRALAGEARGVVRHLLGMGRTFELIDTPRTEVQIPGCGVVDVAAADVIWGSHLMEMKLMAKPFTVREVRQALIYIGLLLIAGDKTIDFLVLANPRRAEVLRFELDELLEMCGGLTRDQFADELAGYLVLRGASG